MPCNQKMNNHYTTLHMHGLLSAHQLVANRDTTRLAVTQSSRSNSRLMAKQNNAAPYAKTSTQSSRTGTRQTLAGKEDST